MWDPKAYEAIAGTDFEMREKLRNPIRKGIRDKRDPCKGDVERNGSLLPIYVKQRRCNQLSVGVSRLKKIERSDLEGK